MKDSELKERRIRVVVAFIGLFAVGLGLFYLAPDKSLLRAIGLAFMIAWLPGVAWFTLWFAKKRAPIKRVPRGFSPDSPYDEHMQIEATFSEDPNPRIGVSGTQELSCLLLLGTEGFTTRLWLVASEEAHWVTGKPIRLVAQFLSPAVARPRFAPGTATKLLIGRTVVGHATVLSSTDA